MKEPDHIRLHRLSSHVGHEITRVERLRYDFQGQRELEGGDVQLWFDDGVVHLSVASDGETLRLEQAPWQDAFSGPLSSENEEYIASHGKWTLVDVSSELPFAGLVGNRLAKVSPLANRFGKLVGAQMVAGDVLFNVYVRSDEITVSWGAEAAPFWGRESDADDPDEPPSSPDSPGRDSSECRGTDD
jgi:hypothetical protein